jgi:CheY-like chemotaxis protein
MNNIGLGGIRILIVEDDISSRLYLNKILEKTGAFLINAGNGKEAVDIALSDQGINIILMDIQLPVMDGYSAARKIKESRPEVRIIAQTAYGMTGDMENLIESGFDDYIIKPIFSANLIELIKKHLPYPDSTIIK